MVSKTNNSKLKFAALRRVSTERQKKKGESLAVQKEQIELAVEVHGGKIVKWYGGQEHGTEGFEKQQIKRLLSDAEKGKFDAVICAHPDRWSRDNAQHAEGIKILRNAGVRFFVLGHEHDLHDPTGKFMLDISTTIGSYNAALQNDKSMTSRIARAKRGIPSSGQLPYGRVYDANINVWGVDEDKKTLIQTAARRYLDGESLRDLAMEYGMVHSAMHNIFTNRSGDVWIQTFKYRGQKYQVPTTIPRLLPDATIRAIKKKAKANKTYSMGQTKNKFLLSGMLFCKHCNHALFGQAAQGGKYRYYRHGAEKTRGGCGRPKSCKNQVKAGVIEDTAITYLFEMFGDPTTVQAAIEKAMPNLKKLEQDRRRIESIEKELKKLLRGRSRILKLIVDDALSDDEAKSQLSKLKDRENLLTEEKDRLEDNQSGQPTPEQIEEISKKVSKQFRPPRSVRVGTARRRSTSKAWFDAMKYADKKGLVQAVFSGETPDGRHQGIYIEWDEKGGWSFDIHGQLIDRENLLPHSKSLSDEDEVGSKQDELLSGVTSKY